MPNKINLSRKEKRLEGQRKQFWPEVHDSDLWSRQWDGYATMPRCMPLFMEVIDTTSKKASPAGKATPAGRAYLALWCRAGDACVVKVVSEKAIALEAGYYGERAVSTWREHLRVLRELGFIKLAPSGDGEYASVLLLNPYQVCAQLAKKGWLSDARLKNALEERRDEVGDNSPAAEGEDE